MNVYEIQHIDRLLEHNAYAGRGIVIGTSADGKSAVAAYFIMGRSENSRNRVFVQENGLVRTEPFDAAKVRDPSLIIYNAVRPLGDDLIVTNGDQTDTIYTLMQQGQSFSQALETRQFEPDAPNLTPRISGLLHRADGRFSYELSILKSADAEGSACCRFTFSYPSVPGLGHFLHTYVCDGSPLPTFQGEPERVAVPDGIDEFTDRLWTGLNAENRISLYVRYTDIRSGAYTDRLVNKNRPADR